MEAITINASDGQIVIHRAGTPIGIMRIAQLRRLCEARGVTWGEVDDLFRANGTDCVADVSWKALSMHHRDETP